MNGSLGRRFLGTVLFSAFVGLSLAACDGGSTTTSTSSGGGGEGGSGGGGSSASNGERYAQALCDRVFDCCNTADLTERFGTNSNVVDYAGCRILYRTLWDGAIDPIVAEGIKAGRVEFNQTNFDACMKSVGELSCADFDNSSANCENIFTPKVAPGQTCQADLECVDGTCEFAKDAPSGSCVAKPAPVALGGACMTNGECAEGLYCNAAKCDTRKADGQDCNDDDECQAGACVGDAQGPGKCGKVCEGGGPGPGAIDKTLESIGGEFVVAECGKFFDCCVGAELDTVLFPGIRAESQCLGLFGAFLGVGLVDLHNSSVQGKVEIDAAALETCLNQFSAQSCQDFAKSASFECLDGIKGLLADGTSCTDDNQCTSKWCNESMPNQGKCATLPGVGAPCVSDCAQGLYCDGATCVAQKALGAMCNGTQECAEGRCSGAGGMMTCALVCDGI
jgi:hypothetical protein